MLEPPAIPGLTAAQVQRLSDAAREADPLALLQAVHEVGQVSTGHRLCTAMRFDAVTMTVQRIWSSDPVAYPVGGAKPKRDTAWGTQVLLQGRAFVGEGEDAIRAHFADHAVILGLGLRSIVNLPILARGACRGTLNLLWAEAAVPPGRRAMAGLLGLLATPAWLS